MSKLFAALWRQDRLLNVASVLALVSLALWSRLRYVVGSYTYTYDSGDSHAVLLKALLLSHGDFTNSARVFFGSPLSSPPLIHGLMAGISRVFAVPIHDIPLFLTPTVTIIGLLALFGMLRKVFDPLIAFLSVGLVALLPRLSFESTEPDKSPYVLAFFFMALFALYLGRERRPWLIVAGCLMGLSVFSHVTGYILLPVFFASHVMLAWRRDKRFDRYFLLPLILPLLFVGLFVMFSQLSEPPATAASLPAQEASATETRGTLQLYTDSALDLVRNGFQARAGTIYFDAIKEQLTTPVYVLGIAGFALGCIVLWRERRWELTPLLAWMPIVTVTFALQYESFSHVSRYPSYVTPVFTVMAVFFVVWTARQIASWLNQLSFSVQNGSAPIRRLSGKTVGKFALAGLLLAFLIPTAQSYAFAPKVQHRETYGGHRQFAEYVEDTGLLEDGTGLLYVGWTSTTYFLLNNNFDYRDQLYAFGWNRRDIEAFTPEFIQEHNIRYYLFDWTGGDYFDSSNTMLEQLSESFQLRQVAGFSWESQLSNSAVARYEANPGRYRYVVLYELRPRPIYDGTNRWSCNEIRGTPFLSEQERQWFQANCVAPLQ